MRGLKIAGSLFRIMELTIRKLELNAGALGAAFTPDIFAADEAYGQVLQGKSFRDAYREVGFNLEKLTVRNPSETLRNRQSQGTAGNLRLDLPRNKNSELEAFFLAARRHISESFENLAGFRIKI
jgi:argininosuccinate lyase